MKTISLFLATSLCLALQSFGAHIHFANDIGKTSVETKFDLYGGGVGTLEESQSGYSTDGSLIRASQFTGYHMAESDGTDKGDPFAAYNIASLSSHFSGDGLYINGDVDSEQWGDGVDYPWDHKPLVTHTNVAAAVSLYWDFFVIGGDVAIKAGVAANDPTHFTQYVRLSGPGGFIFDLNPDSSSDGYSGLPAPLTLTPGRYQLQASIGEINGDDDEENWFQVQISGVDSFSRRDVPDGGTSLALLAGGVFSIYAGRRLVGRKWLVK